MAEVAKPLSIPSIMDEAEICELEMQAICLTGAQRYLNQVKTGSSTLMPPGRNIEADNTLMERQREELTPGQLATYQMELLRRVEAFAFFFDANVGGSEDFPMQLVGENEATMTLFKEHYDRVKNALGVLTEV